MTESTTSPAHPAPTGGAGPDGLPRWSLHTVFPHLHAPQYTAARAAVLEDLQALRDTYRRHGVAPGSHQVVTDGFLAAFDTVVPQTNRLLDAHRTIAMYLSALLWADAGDEDARSEQASFRAATSEVFLLVEDLKAWVTRVDQEQLIDVSHVAAAHTHFLGRAADAARHRMPAAAEALHQGLREYTGAAWLGLYHELAADIGPYPVVAGAGHLDATTLHQDNIGRWHAAGPSLAAALNAIKGEELLISRLRGWRTPLDERADTEGVEIATLTAMFDAVRAVLPEVRTYLEAKARLLGHEASLPWWEIPAPLPGSDAVAWHDALALVQKAFGSHSSDLGSLPRHAVDRQWIDAQPRPAKRSRALCVMVADGEPRILLAYDGSYQSVLSLAHELGHAHHYGRLEGATWLQRDIPLAVSETASGFCEALVGEELLRTAPPAEHLARLDALLVRQCQNIVDALVWFTVEERIFSERAAAPLSEGRLCDLMIESQREVYGASVLPATLHPYWWAARADTLASAYSNWQYCFGTLLGTALHTATAGDQDERRHLLDEILSRSGTERLSHLMRSAGIDLADPAFWEGSLTLMRQHITEFVTAAGDVA
ncbi:M3 family metallopeptidase [Streptomyces spororaveus]|uniref:M3 family metallopeptidase n=2 Tax=Streptomyces spororaveus TaxID=284039 RepID=UPI001920C525|nr:M3 family metallopeptidase [Streptomyces spororaveus]